MNFKTQICEVLICVWTGAVWLGVVCMGGVWIVGAWMGCVWTAEVWKDDVATGDVCTETSRYCSAWTRSLKTRGVDSGDVLLGEVGADEPSTANRPIHSIS